jgi:hypothetical protein
MIIEKSGSDDFEAAWAALLDALQQQRADLLGSTIDIHVGIGLLAGAEANRLADKYGADDARVRLLRDRSDAVAARVDALSVEQEIATVRTPPPPPAAGALIQGRVTDMMQRAAGQVTVQVIDEKGQAVAGIEPVQTDDSGFFAFELTPEMVKAAQSKLSVVVRVADVQLVPAAVQPIAVAPGATQVMDVSLSAAELERLRLRLPVTLDKAAVNVSTAEVATTTDKAADGTNAADKVAVDKGAADKAAVETKEQQPAPAKAADDAAPDTASDKTASEKTTDEKAASDKPATKPKGGTTRKKG